MILFKFSEANLYFGMHYALLQCEFSIELSLQLTARHPALLFCDGTALVGASEGSHLCAENRH